MRWSTIIYCHICIVFTFCRSAGLQNLWLHCPQRRMQKIEMPSSHAFREISMHIGLEVNGTFMFFYNNNACLIFHCAVSSFVDWKQSQVLGNGKKRRRTLPCNELCHGSISGKQPTQTELHGMRWDAIFVRNGDWNFEDDKLPSNM